MKLKSGVSLDGLRKEITRVLIHVEVLFNLAGKPLTLTCTTGDHKKEDPHTWGFAVDCRVHGLSLIAQAALRSDLQHKLGSEYFVKLEDSGGPNEHIHIQLRKALWRALVRAEGHLEISA